MPFKSPKKQVETVINMCYSDEYLKQVNEDERTNKEVVMQVFVLLLLAICFNIIGTTRYQESKACQAKWCLISGFGHL